MTKTESVEEYIKIVVPMLPLMDKEQLQAFREKVYAEVDYITDDIWEKTFAYYPMLGNDQTVNIPIQND